MIVAIFAPTGAKTSNRHFFYIIWNFATKPLHAPGRGLLKCLLGIFDILILAKVWLQF